MKLKYTTGIVLFVATFQTVDGMLAIREFLEKSILDPFGNQCSLSVTKVGEARRYFFETREGVALCENEDADLFYFDSTGKCSYGSPVKCPDTNLFTIAASQTHNRPKLKELETDEDNIDIISDLRKTQKARRLNGFSIEEEPMELHNIVLLIQFSDHSPLFTKSDYETFFNSASENAQFCPTGSVQKFFLDNSYNQLKVVSHVSDWIQVPFTEAEAAGGFVGETWCNGACSSSKLRDAIKFAIDIYDQTIDDELKSLLDSNFDQMVDMLTIVHSGMDASGSRTSDGNTRIWSHKWSLPNFHIGNSGLYYFEYNVNPGIFHTENSDGSIKLQSITRLGVVAHESTHYLNIIDYYVSFCMFVFIEVPDSHCLRILITLLLVLELWDL